MTENNGNRVFKCYKIGDEKTIKSKKLKDDNNNIVREIEEMKTNIKKAQIEIKRMSNHQKQIFKLCNSMRKDIHQIQHICRIKRNFIEPSDSSDSDSDSDADSFIIY